MRRRAMLPYSSTVVTLTLLASAAAEGPCDILVAAGNPCVAAHSTVRALYARYAGPLYKVSRPDGGSADVGVLEAGGFAVVEVPGGAHEVVAAAAAG